MKKLLFLFLIIISFSAHAQRMLVLADTPRFANQNKGVLVLRISDNLPYYSDGFRWVAIKGGIGVQTIADSLLAYNLRNVTSFNGKKGSVNGVDSVFFSVSGDSLKWRYNNIIFSRKIIDTSNKFVNRIEKNLSQDSIIFYIGATRFALLDRAGGGGGGITDGNKFDIIVTSSGAIWTVADTVYNKIKGLIKDSLNARKFYFENGTDEIGVPLVQVKNDSTIKVLTPYTPSGNGLTIANEGDSAAKIDVDLPVLKSNLNIPPFISLSAVGNAPNGNGATYNPLTGLLTFQPANLNFGGFVTNGSQFIGGNKKFYGNVSFGGSNATGEPAMDMMVNNWGVQRGELTTAVAVSERFGDGTGWHKNWGRFQNSSHTVVYKNDEQVYMTLRENSLGGANFGIGTINPQANFHTVGTVRHDLGDDATGDIYYRSNLGNLVPLPIGVDSQFLSIVAGIPKWLNKPTSSGGASNNLANTNLTQTGGNRTYSGASQNLTFNGGGGTALFNVEYPAVIITGQNSGITIDGDSITVDAEQGRLYLKQLKNKTTLLSTDSIALVDISGRLYKTPASAIGGLMVYPAAGIALSTGSAWGTSIADNSANWNTVLNRLLIANNLSDLANVGTARTNLGGTTIGQNIFTSTNPSAIRFGRANADNSFSWLDAASFRTAIGAGTGAGDLLAANNLNDVANATTARANLGLAIGTNILAFRTFGTAANNNTGDFEVPLTFSTGLTRATNSITVNNILNIIKLSNLTSNGYLKTSAGDGTLTVSATVAGADVSGNIAGNAATATALAAGITIGITGDLTYTSPSFDGSANVTAAGTLSTVNGNVGSFTNANVTVDAKGRITAVSNGSASGGFYTPSVLSTDATNADYTAVVNSIKLLPSATLTANRTITIPTGANGDCLFINNNETSFIWNVTGGLIYLSDRTTTLSSFLANTNYIIYKVSGKWVIQN